MTTKPSGDTQYEVVEWDFDAAPDAVDYFSHDYSDEELAESILPCYCSKRWRTDDLYHATEMARYAVEVKNCVGAAVFLGEKMVYGFHCTWPYKKKYF